MPDNMGPINKKVRHIINISGGKDSSALAIYMRDRGEWQRRLAKKQNSNGAERISFEYVFCDTKKELSETYEYLDLLESYLGQKIVRLSDDRGFDHWLEVYGNYLPSANMRWCTRMLKIKPFEVYVADDAVLSYIAIRADENRDGYISSKPNIHPVYPFKEDGVTLDDVHRILKESGLSLPKYYEWRTRSGCYFCFFQRKSEWVGLLERHPDDFEKAKAYEKIDPNTGKRYTWSQGESLEELARPERMDEIKQNQKKAMERERKAQPKKLLVDILAQVLDDEDDTEPCMICNL